MRFDAFSSAALFIPNVIQMNKCRSVEKLSRNVCCRVGGKKSNKFCVKILINSIDGHCDIGKF